MNSRRDRNARTALFDGIEEGGIRASSSYSHEIDEQENDRAIDGLQDRVVLLKRVISMKKSRLITVCLTGWVTIWIPQEEFYPGPWINLRWCLRRNQAGVCLHSWYLSWSFSWSYIILQGELFYLGWLRRICKLVCEWDVRFVNCQNSVTSFCKMYDMVSCV